MLGFCSAFAWVSWLRKAVPAAKSCAQGMWKSKPAERMELGGGAGQAMTTRKLSLVVSFKGTSGSFPTRRVFPS